MERLSRLFFASCVVLSGCWMGKPRQSAECGVVEFHIRYDNERFGQLYAEADSEMKSRNSEAEFIDFMRAIRRKLGKVQAASRAALTITVNRFGTQVRSRYVTKFEHGTGTESFIWRVRADTARLVGYNLTSPDMQSALNDRGSGNRLLRREHPRLPEEREILEKGSADSAGKCATR